jgi:RND family efflux transporter MFP subunit
MRPDITIPLLCVLPLLPGCHSRTERTGLSIPAVPVVTAHVEKINSTRDISLSGNIEGSKTVRLGFLVAGKIDFIATGEGGQVSRNSLLASIEPTSYAIAKEMADIQVSQVQDEYDRLKLMHDRNSLSESDFAKITYGLGQAKAQQKLHTKNLQDTRLYSPIDGVLLKKLAETGEITGVGIPLFVVSDIRKVNVSAYIPENELHSVRIGQKAKITVSSVAKDYEGTITEVGSAADPASRSFLLKIEVENQGLLIRPGMIAEVKIPSVIKENILAVPAIAVGHDFNDQSFVFVADSVKNKAYKRFVSPGKIFNDKIEITSGLQEGELVVTGGNQKLVEGSGIIITK